MFRFMYKYALPVTILAIMGCADDNKYIRSPNHAPSIRSITVDRDTIRDQRERVALNCLATDIDGDELSYLWEADYGSFSSPTDYYYSEWFPNYAPPGIQYIRVRVSDQYTSVEDSIRIFNSNFPPETPHSESPANGDTILSTNPQLNWLCSDPDGPFLDFQVRLGTSYENMQPLLIYCSPPTEPLSLSAHTTYYWQVYASDCGGNSATGPIWHFTTQ